MEIGECMTDMMFFMEFITKYVEYWNLHQHDAVKISGMTNPDNIVIKDPIAFSCILGWYTNNVLL